MGEYDKEYGACTYYHALVAVLYALKRGDISLDLIRQSVEKNIAGQEGIRPPPQIQNEVLEALEQSINDVKS